MGAKGKCHSPESPLKMAKVGVSSWQHAFQRQHKPMHRKKSAILLNRSLKVKSALITSKPIRKFFEKNLICEWYWNAMYLRVGLLRKWFDLSHCVVTSDWQKTEFQVLSSPCQSPRFPWRREQLATCHKQPDTFDSLSATSHGLYSPTFLMR